MKTLFRAATVINEGTSQELDVLVEGEKIARIAPAGTIDAEGAEVIDARGKYLLPGLIDDQVHFREPGLTHKGDLFTESRAAVAGGITTFMEMPNTVPQALTQDLLQWKYDRAAEVSVANYSFFMGASNDNIEEVLKTDPKHVCGVKVFMGSSTGNMLVDQRAVLEGIFKEAPCLVATHCEDEPTVRANMEAARAQYGEEVPIGQHPIIRSEEACYRSSSMAVELAEKHGTRLHILHISTAKETHLFRNDVHRTQKKITSEACMHHLWFSDADYATHGTRIKWNPAVKTAADRAEIRQAVIDGRIDVLATDHAPHTIEEKAGTYFKAPSGGPLVQHALVAALELCNQGVFTKELVVDKYCHAVADLFDIATRGYIREGYHADLVLVDPNSPWTVATDNIRYKCGWSPFEGTTFQHKVMATYVNGQRVYSDADGVNEEVRGQRLMFAR